MMVYWFVVFAAVFSIFFGLWGIPLAAAYILAVRALGACLQRVGAK